MISSVECILQTKIVHFFLQTEKAYSNRYNSSIVSIALRQPVYGITPHCAPGVHAFYICQVLAMARF